MGARISEAVAIADDEGGELRVVSLPRGGEHVARIEHRESGLDAEPYFYDLDAATLRELRLGLERIEKVHAAKEPKS